jgi:AraC-like DNA-binding protein
MTDGTVSAGFVRALLEFAVSRGAARDTLLEDAAIDAGALGDQDARLPFASYVALMRAGKRLTGDEALALHFGEAVQLARFSIVGLLGQASETMLEAFAQLNRYVRLIVDIECASADRFELRRERGGLWMVDTRLSANAFAELTESAFAQTVCRPLAAGLPRIAFEIHVTHAAPAYAAEYERVLQAPVTFAADWNAIRLNEAVVERRVSILPRYVFGVLTDHADALLRELENATTVRGQVEKLMLPLLHTGEVSAGRVAQQLGVSRQTLYRNLKAEGVTFEHVLDELRHRMALHYLRGKKASLNDIAYLVGFSDPTSFSRAFKRWTGKSPSEMRGG